MVILGAQTAIQTIYNFCALAIIKEFDNFVFGQLKTQAMALLVTEEAAAHLLKI